MRLLALLLAALIGLISVSPAFADSPEDYRWAAVEALSIVQHALERQDASPSAASAEAAQMLDRINVVDLGDGRQVSIDKGWVLSPLQKSPPDLVTAEARLRQLLDEMGGRPGTTIATEKAETALRQEADKLAPPKTQRMPWDDWLDTVRGLLGRIGAWIAGLLRGGESSQQEQGSTVPWWLVGAPALVLVAAALALLARSLRRAVVSEGAATTPEAESERLASDEALAQSKAYAAAGHFRDALRTLYLATVLQLDEREQIRFDPSLTNREYLRRAAGQERLAEALRPLVAAFDSIWYGQRDCTPTEFEECCRLARVIGLAV